MAPKNGMLYLPVVAKSVRIGGLDDAGERDARTRLSEKTTCTHIFAAQNVLRPTMPRSTMSFALFFYKNETNS